MKAKQARYPASMGRGGNSIKLKKLLLVNKILANTNSTKAKDMTESTALKQPRGTKSFTL